MTIERFTFPGHAGDALAARLDMPEGPHLATALFAHCFTCGKDITAARRIAGRLSAMGIAVLRFDFTGLGHSGGEFANTTFTSNIDDLVNAASHLAQRGMAPSLLIGHSLGGAAVLKAATQIDSIKAVATIAAPFDPEHVTHNFRRCPGQDRSRWRGRGESGGPTIPDRQALRAGCRRCRTGTLDRDSWERLFWFCTHHWMRRLASRMQRASSWQPSTRKAS